MQRKLKSPYFELIFDTYSVEKKIIHFDELQYFFRGVFQNYKFEVDFFRVLRYIITLQEFELCDKISILTN